MSFALLETSTIWMSMLVQPTGGLVQPDVTFLISLASLATSGASLAGFVITSGLAWRKERREAKHSEVDLEKKKLEVEKLRLELAAKQTENAQNSAAKPEA